MEEKIIRENILCREHIDEIYNLFVNLCENERFSLIPLDFINIFTAINDKNNLSSCLLSFIVSVIVSALSLLTPDSYIIEQTRNHKYNTEELIYKVRRSHKEHCKHISNHINITMCSTVIIFLESKSQV